MRNVVVACRRLREIEEVVTGFMMGPMVLVCMLATLTVGEAASQTADANTPASQADTKAPKTAKMDPKRIRLSRHVLPITYKLYIEPDLENRQFSGRETILVDVVKPVKEIVLNIHDLEVAEPELSEVSRDGIHGEWLKPSTRVDETNQQVRFRFQRKIAKGRHELRLKFAGTLNDKLVGFYYSSAKDERGEKFSLASTQMEPTDARRVFPCFDEPDMKATFKITLAVDKDLTAISNAGVQFVKEDKRTGKKIFTFLETPRMSTYLVALIVGPFEATDPVTVNGVQVKTWATRGKKEQGIFGREVAVKLLPYFEDYFGVEYPMKKMDLIAIPDFGPGAMENLGAITFRETRLLVDEATASTKTKQDVASVVAHEMAHMWFGDLVTMKWWDDIWLNEAFATWMSVKAVNHIRPDWRPWDAFTSERATALATDALASTRPIFFKVRFPSEAEQMFDEITYEKGASVLRMLEKYLGEETYKKGIQLYIKMHKFGNAANKDLWDALAEASGKPVVKIMREWIFRPGYPVISARLDEKSGRVIVEQKRFWLSPSEKGSTRWRVPLTARIANQSKKESVKILLTKRQEALPDFGVDLSDQPVVVNANADGYFRVEYEDAMLTRLADGIGNMSEKERYQLLSDSWALVEAGSLPIERYLDLTGSYVEERDPTVMELLVKQLNKLDLYVADESREQFAAFVRSRLTKLAGKLGWQAGEKESDLTQLLRANVLLALGTLGQDEVTIKTARDHFETYLSSPEKLNPNLYDAIVGIVAYNGDARDYARLKDCWKTSRTPESKVRNLIALADFRKDPLIRETLELSLTDDVRTQDAPHLILHLMKTRAGRSQGWEFVKQNWGKMQTRFPSKLFSRLLKGARSLTTDADAQDVASFLTGHPIETARRTQAKVVDRVKLNARFNERSATALNKWLAGTKG